MNSWGLMMSFLDNWSQSQLPRALGTFSSWVWPGQIFSLESHFPLNISPFFSYGSHYCAQLFLLFHLNQLSLGKISGFPDVHKLGFAHGPGSLSLSQTFKWDNVCANTLYKADMWTLPLFSLHPWRAEAEIAFLWDGALILRAYVCFHVSLFTTFAETDKCSN